MESTPKNTKDVSTLLEIAGIIVGSVRIEDALSGIVRILEDAGLSNILVTFLDKKTRFLKIMEGSAGLLPKYKKIRFFRMGEGIAGRVFESGEPIIVKELAKAEHLLPLLRNSRSAIDKNTSLCSVPIKRGQEVLGTLSAEFPMDSVSPLPLLEKTARLIAQSIAMREKLKQQNETETSEPAALERDPLTIERGSGMVGASSVMRTLYEMICQVAPSEATVLICGESGTGKELIAREILRLSRRHAESFVKLNCAALPLSIIESELFGHEKGAFTGALSRHAGKFETADGGTLFLDEIGELPPEVQVKLLRVLQEREIERVGGSGTVKVNVRLIAATNKNLEAEVKNGRFREDLFYRLNVFPISAPPLRERKSDITLLADHFIEKYAARNDKAIKRISAPAIDLLMSYHWPGNIRELENCIERAVILTKDSVIHSYHLPPSLQTAQSTNTEPASTLGAALSRLEKEMIIDALRAARGNTAEAASRLGITNRMMGLRLHHYGINWRTFRH